MTLKNRQNLIKCRHTHRETEAESMKKIERERQRGKRDEKDRKQTPRKAA